MDQYKRGLSKPLCEKMYTLIPMPTDLAGWMEKACILDKQFRIGKLYQTDVTPTRTSTWTPRPFPPHRTTTMRDPNAMDIDRIKTMCFTCGMADHQTNLCTKARSDVSCAYCKSRGHIIADCHSPFKKPFPPTRPPFKTRVNDLELETWPKSEIEALKAKMKDF
jgi:hypothetical protein